MLISSDIKRKIFLTTSVLFPKWFTELLNIQRVICGTLKQNKAFKYSHTHTHTHTHTPCLYAATAVKTGSTHDYSVAQAQVITEGFKLSCDSHNLLHELLIHSNSYETVTSHPSGNILITQSVFG